MVVMEKVEFQMESAKLGETSSLDLAYVLMISARAMVAGNFQTAFLTTKRHDQPNGWHG